MPATAAKTAKAKRLPLTKAARPYFYDTIIDKTITASEAGKTVNLSGYSQVAVLARFEGPANGHVAFEVGAALETVFREEIDLNAAGWFNFAKVYPVFAPQTGVGYEICFGIPDAKMSSFSKKYPATVSVTLKRGQQILVTDWYACYRNIIKHHRW